MRVTAVTCVRNEGPFLLEWVAYHRLIGVTDFLVYSNDCTDGTDTLLDALAPCGVRHLPNPARGRAYQVAALRDAALQPEVVGADWVWVADVDEFLNIHTGAHRIADLVAACGTPQAISVSHQFFANGGVHAFADSPVIAQFTTTHNPDIWGADTAIEVKTLTRHDFPLGRFGAHRPFAHKGTRPAAWTDGSGRPVPPKFLTAASKRHLHRFPAAGARRYATLNHYALRSLDSYLVKCDRGDVNRDGRVFDETYWRARNDSGWQERSILRLLPALEDALAEIKSGPPGALHDDCVAHHRARRDALLADPERARLHAHISALPALPPAEAALARKLGLSA